MVFGPARSRAYAFDDDDDVTDWMAQRNAQLAGRDAADAAGRAAWNQATQTGDDVAAATPHDLIELGNRSLRHDGAGGSAQQPTDSSASVEPARRIEADGQLVTPPNLRFATARSGDSISKLVGTSDAAAVGRFMSLNAMDPRNSTILAGQRYAAPTSFDDASNDEIAAGARALQTDDARLAALRAQQAAARRAADQWQERFDSGRNVWTGEPATVGASSSAPLVGPPVSGVDSIQARRDAARNGYLDGFIPGVVRGGYHALQGFAEAGVVGAEVSNPALDHVLGFFGQSAEDRLRPVVEAADRDVAEAMAHPAAAWQNAKDLGHHINVEFNPFATPLPATTGEAYRNGERVAENDGELAFNVGTIPVGGELGATVEGMKYAAEAGDVGKYLEAGFDLKSAQRLAKPYKGMAHHAWARKRALPRMLGGGLMPDWLSESPLNRLQPRGIDTGQMYELHYQVDPNFYGARLSDRGRGQGWSGRRLGLQKYDTAGQTWHGIPGLTKGVATGAALDFGDDVYVPSTEGNPQ